MDEDLFDVGLEARKRVLGDEYVERAFASADGFNIEFQRLVTEYCWGAVWGRSALTDRQRSLNNLCLLAALNRPEEFKTHFRGALRNGCTLDELRDYSTKGVRDFLSEKIPGAVQTPTIISALEGGTPVLPAGETK